MTDEKRETLKNLMINGKNLSEVYCYYLDHFGEQEDFFDMGKSYSPEQDFLQIMGAALKPALPKTGNWVALTGHYIEVKKYNIQHGVLKNGDSMINFLYLPDIGVGMVVVFSMKNPSMSNFVRFSKKPLEDMPKDRDVPTIITEVFKMNPN